MIKGCSTSRWEILYLCVLVYIDVVFEYHECIGLNSTIELQNRQP